MSDFPVYRKQPVPFRGGASSEVYNQSVEETFYDLNHLYNLLDQQESALSETTEVFTIQNLFQQIRLDDLQGQIANLQEEVQRLKGAVSGYTQKILVAQMDPDPTADPTQKASVDAAYGVLTLPIGGEVTSKVYLYDAVLDKTFQPNTLQVDISPPSSGNPNIVENDPKQALDGDNYTYWHRKCFFGLDDPTDSVEAVLTITLPDDIISNRDINMIALNPFPLNTLIVEKVEYKLQGDWVLLPGFPTDEAGNPIPYQNAGYLKFHFPMTAVGEVRISLRQKHWVTENNQKVFHLGLQEVGVFYLGYQGNTGRIQLPLTLQGKANSHLITAIMPHFANAGALSDRTENKNDIFTYTVYQMDANGNLSYTKDNLPIVVSSDTILIKAAIFQDAYTRVTPALDSLTITYQDA